MSDQPIPADTITHDVLAASISRALSELPGIIRLEPTLRSTLTRFRSLSVQGLHKLASMESGIVSTGLDGIHLTLRDGVVDVSVDIATDITHGAVSTAAAAQQCAADIIQRSGLMPGTIDVMILSIESSSSGTE